jgi:hypothetical protein
MHVEDPGPPLRQPAQYGREVVRRLALRALSGLAALALVTIVTGLTAGWRSSAFVVVEALAIVCMLVGDRVLTPVLDRREQGNEGELKVARVLGSLEDSGWRTLHDVSVGRGNIDHLVVGPGGILTIETKSRRGRVQVEALPQEWLSQAYAQAKAIERITGASVDALLVFSDAYLDKRISRQRGVCVLPARMLAGHLARRPPKLTPDDVDRLYGRLAHALNG